MTETTIPSIEPQLVLPLFGARDQHLKRIREQFDVDITHRDGTIRIRGESDDVAQAKELLNHLTNILRKRGMLTPEIFEKTVSQVTGEPVKPVRPSIDIVQMGRKVTPRTEGQANYVESIRKNELVFCVGPAGCGKTYLAVAMAVEALKHQAVRKIVLVRPAVEAGENLGYLPGDMQAKINPYLRPLLDATFEMMGFDQAQQLIAQDVIEVVPLAYMRGRTLNEAFIILDEAQNTTVSQMKMFLTRMGEHSRIVVTGDPTQVDLPRGTRSGLQDAIGRLRPIKGVSIVRLATSDIVRHRLVQDIVDAYERPQSKPHHQEPDGDPEKNVG